MLSRQDAALKRIIDDPASMKHVLQKLDDLTDTDAGPSGCWIYHGQMLPTGYGTIYVGSENGYPVRVFAHRAAYVRANGILPPDGLVCHRCDNPPCCNPAHLFSGTDKDNAADKLAKGRHRYGAAKRGEENHLTKFTSEQALEVVRLTKLGQSRPVICSALGVTPGFVDKIRCGGTWSHVTGYTRANPMKVVRNAPKGYRWRPKEERERNKAQRSK